VIEKAKRFSPDIFIPSQWIEIIKKAKKREPKFKVTEMTTQDFYGNSPLEKDIVKRKTFTDGKKVEWLKTSWIRLEKENPRVLKMMQTHNEDYPFSTLDLNRRVRGRRQAFGNMQLPHLYPNGRTLPRDLLSLCQDIPPVHHPFYKELKSSDVVEGIDLVVDSDLDDGQYSLLPVCGTRQSFGDIEFEAFVLKIY
jgi:hypothetical protein